jgi:hypothetical protein
VAALTNWNISLLTEHSGLLKRGRILNRISQQWAQ